MNLQGKISGDAKLPWSWVVLVGCFLTFFTAGERVPVLLRTAMVLSLVMIGIVLVHWSRTGVRIPAEIGILCVFLLWAVLSGFSAAIDVSAFINGIKRMIQVILVVLCVSSFSARTRSPAVGLLSLTLLALVLAVYGLVTGDFSAASEMTERGDRLVAHRATSLTSNANALGVSCVWAMGGIAFLWRSTRGAAKRCILAALIVPLIAGVVFSGSRKAALSFPVFVLAWLSFCYGRALLRKASLLIGIGLAALLFLFFGAFVLRDTYVGYRLRSALSASDRDASTQKRILILEEGVEMFCGQPITGVGLGQFGANSSYAGYAHNDFVEVAATTGLVGFITYYSFFVLVCYKLILIRRKSKMIAPTAHYDAGVCLALLVTCFSTAFSLVMFSSVVFWCLISGILGFVYSQRMKIGVTSTCPKRPPYRLAMHHA